MLETDKNLNDSIATNLEWFQFFGGLILLVLLLGNFALWLLVGNSHDWPSLTFAVLLFVPLIIFSFGITLASFRNKYFITLSIIGVFLWPIGWALVCFLVGFEWFH